MTCVSLGIKGSAKVRQVTRVRLVNKMGRTESKVILETKIR